MPIALPPSDNLFPHSEAAQHAYGRILSLEATHPMYIRILGGMLIHAPNDAGREYIARSINQCANDATIIETGKHYYQYFVKYFRAIANKPTPTPSSHPSRESMDAQRDIILTTLVQAPASHSQAKEHALVRDAYRCQLSGRFDEKAYGSMQSVRDKAHANPAAGLGSTQCHHILPQYIGHNITDNPPRSSNSATIWSIVTNYGGITLDELNGNGIHNLGNIMTLTPNIHDAMDGMRMWLEPIEGQDHTYRVGRVYPLSNPEVPQTVVLTTDYQVPLPDRRYLALHAACARIAHMSGAAEAIDSHLRDKETNKVLASDGSSGSFLDIVFCGHIATWSLRT